MWSPVIPAIAGKKVPNARPEHKRAVLKDGLKTFSCEARKEKTTPRPEARGWNKRR
jgi:hypothetical protein